MFENTCRGVYFKFSWFGADKFFEKETFSRVFKKIFKVFGAHFLQNILG